MPPSHHHLTLLAKKCDLLVLYKCPPPSLFGGWPDRDGPCWVMCWSKQWNLLYWVPASTKPAQNKTSQHCSACCEMTASKEDSKHADQRRTRGSSESPPGTRHGGTRRGTDCSCGMMLHYADTEPVIHRLCPANLEEYFT